MRRALVEPIGKAVPAERHGVDRLVVGEHGDCNLGAPRGLRRGRRDPRALHLDCFGWSRTPVPCYHRVSMLD